MTSRDEAPDLEPAASDAHAFTRRRRYGEIETLLAELHAREASNAERAGLNFANFAEFTDRGQYPCVARFTWVDPATAAQLDGLLP